nr:glutamate receptor 1.2-like [Ipomoea batatas]
MNMSSFESSYIYDGVVFSLFGNNESSSTTLRIGIPVNTRFNKFVAFKHESETGAMDHLDAVVGDTTITSDRLSLVDFTLPYTDPGVGTVARLQQRQGMWFFLKPMVAQLWILFIISCVCVGAIVWLIEHQINEQFQGSIAQQIGTALWFAFSSLFYAHRENLRSNLSRFVVIVWLFIVFIMTSVFTARLSSLLTAQQIQSPMDDYMGFQRGSSIHGSVVNNINFDDNRLKHYNSPEEYHEALSKGSKNGGADAIVDEIPYLNAFLSRYPSQYAIIGSETNTDGFGFAFRKGSPLVPEFSRAIAKLREEGRLKQLEKKWFKNNNQPSEEGGLNIYALRGLFVLSVIANAIFLSRFLFFFIRKKLEVEGNVSATEVAPVMQSQIGKAHTNLIDSENPDSASDQFEAANNQWRRLLETLLPSYADAVQSDQNQQAITLNQQGKNVEASNPISSTLNLIVFKQRKSVVTIGSNLDTGGKAFGYGCSDDTRGFNLTQIADEDL